MVLVTFILQLFIKASRRVSWPRAWNEFVLRPRGARNCSILNSGGSYEGRIGMPSGHVLLTAFVVTSLGAYWIGAGTFRGSWAVTTSIVLAAATAIVLMAVSRVRRGCHNLAHVLVGATLGIATGLPFWAYSRQARAQTAG